MPKDSISSKSARYLRLGLAGALAMASANALAAFPEQDNLSGVDQIGNPDSATETEQITHGPATVATSQNVVRETAPPSQLSTSSESAPSTSQLTRESESSGSAPQLYRGGPTAQPSTPLSRPSEGRRSDVVRVQGEDRCDPREGEQREQRACARVIENRAYEFARPSPTKLSPEQRLMSEQPMEETGTVQAAARRLANNAADPNSIEDQSVAAIILSNAQRAQPPTPSEPAEAAPSAIEAIVGAITGTSPPQF